MTGTFGETATALSASKGKATELLACQAKRHRLPAADSSNLSQLGRTESSRKGRAHPSRRIALDAPDALAMQPASAPQLLS
jgi:hypothetical protein